MARLITSGFETNSKTTGIEFDGSSIPGSLSLVTSPVKTGTYAIQAATTSQNSFFFYTPFTSNQTTGVYVKTWFYISSTPVAAVKVIVLYNTSTAQRATIQLSTGNQLQLLNSSGTQIGSNSATLSTSTWYCVEMYVDASISSGVNTARLNGDVFATGAGNSSSGWSKVYFGAVSGSTTTTLVFDGVCINDSTGTTQNSWPGQSLIARATPNAAGDSNGFLVNVGGTAGAANNYTRVSEVTPDGATTYNASATSATDMFAITTPAIPAGAVINAVMVGGQYADTTGADATAAFKFQIEKTTGGTKSQSAAITPNSTTMVVNNVGGVGGASGYPITLYADPDGNAWTPTTIASMQIGYTVSTANTSPLAISGVWALVDYSTEAWVNVTDTATASESVGRLTTNFVSPSDTITTSESNIDTLVSFVNVSDNAALSESIGILVPTLLVTVADNVALSESVQVDSPLLINVSDTLTTSEVTTVDVQTTIAVSDTLTTSEATGVAAATTSLVTSSNLTLSESIVVGMTVSISVSEHITFTESVGIGTVFAPLLVIVTAGIQNINGVKIV